MPTPRHGLASVTVKDRIYVIGGGTVPGLSVSGVNESYFNAQYVPEFDSIILTLVILFASIAILYEMLTKSLVKNL